MRLLEVRDHVLHHTELAVGEPGPEGQIRRARRGLARPSAPGDHAHRKHQKHQSCDRHASHPLRPPRGMELENFTKRDFRTHFPDCQLRNGAIYVRVTDEMSDRAIPPLLRRLNERTVLETIRLGAPISRAEISRRAGISKPTVSLALRSLLDAGL